MNMPQVRTVASIFSVVIIAKIAHKLLFVEQVKQLAAVKLYCID